jgi:nucleoside-diphosphate-sugar epimerase
MTWFITGGSGFLGINLVRYLLARGERVVTFDVAPFDYPEQDSIRSVRGNIRDREALRDAMRGCDVVVHTAAALPLYTAEDIRSTDIDGTRNVLDSAMSLGIARVVHISSTTVYGIPDHHPLTEDDALDGVGEYGKAKIAAEEACVAYRKKGLVVPVLRPKSFIGPERLGVFALLYDWAHEGHNFPMIGWGNNRYQLLDVEDLCSAIYTAGTSADERVNDTFNIGAKEFTTMKEDYQKALITSPAGLHVGKASDYMMLGTTYRQAESTMDKIVQQAWNDISNTTTACALLFAAAAAKMVVPVTGAVAAAPDLAAIALQLTRIVVAASKAAVALETFEGGAKTYLSTQNKND